MTRIMLATIGLLVLAVCPTAAQQPKKEAPPRLVSPEVHADKKVTFRIYAPKATEVTVRGDWMTGPPAKLDEGREGRLVGDRRPARPRTSTATPSRWTGSAPWTRRTRRSSRGSPASTTCSSCAGPEADFQDNKPVPHGDVRKVWYQSTTLGAAADARLHAAGVRRGHATSTRSSTCSTAAATRTPAGARSAGPGSSWTT